MRLFNTFPVLCLALIATFSATNTAASDDDFTQRLHEYHKASEKLQSILMQSLFNISFTLAKEPQVEDLREHGKALPEVLISYKESHERLSSMMENESVKSKYPHIVESLQEDDVSKALPKLEALSSSFARFSASLQEENFSVYSTDGWANSSISVDQGDFIWVKSEGSWQASRNYEPTNSEGYICRSDSYTLNRNAPLGALLYRVRGSSNVNGMALDVEGKGQADTSGRLEFIMNDEDRSNNSGQLKLKVVVMNGEDLKNLIAQIREMEKLTR